MKKNDYLDALNYHLSSIPEPERYDLIRELDRRIAYQLQKGRSEDEILAGLGDPLMRAERMLEERRDRIQKEISQTYSDRPSKRPDFARFVGVGILLFFLNLVALPVIASLGAAVLSLGVSAIAAIASPLLTLLDWFWNSSFYPANLFAHVAVAGVGILLALLFIPLAKLGFRGVVAYGKWNLRLLRGRV
ncbi:DUF1700 domain-containing protein [Cohnella thailandensis]|uniref:DUF1700 domain-containing protein n=1 Tax=Cohnella thailandensis TaxID=557557 RepID=A0A841SX73_9BACL|nr:DUF1700 domain-containing protein [Cohnella thailandensis]MBB6634440.1 DUF1700 domain-containing protein [Cohnella thailandensis]MBP1972060.1 putative membrane protein [Cohnella thailandensis]